MDWISLLGGFRGTQELLQYPEADFYNAAKLLKPEDRPRAFVRSLPDDYPLFKIKPEAAATVNYDKNQILVKKGAPARKNLFHLAGILAHEQQHLDEGPKVVDKEHSAYMKQIRALQRAGNKDPQHVEGLIKTMDKYKR